MPTERLSSSDNQFLNVLYCKKVYPSEITPNKNKVNPVEGSTIKRSQIAFNAKTKLIS